MTNKYIIPVIFNLTIITVFLVTAFGDGYKIQEYAENLWDFWIWVVAVLVVVSIRSDDNADGIITNKTFIKFLTIVDLTIIIIAAASGWYTTTIIFLLAVGVYYNNVGEAIKLEKEKENETSSI